MEVQNSPIPTRWSSEKWVCIPFSVRSLAKPVAQVRVTSTGMAGARLWDVGVGAAASSCELRYEHALTSIAISNVGEDEHALLLVLPVDAFPESAAGAKGKILVLREGWPPGETALTLKRDDYAPYFKAFFWLLGIAVPVVLTGVIGVVVTRLQKRMESTGAERDALQQYRRDKGEELKNFFEALYGNTMALPDDKELRDVMGREFDNLGLLYALPSKQRERLLEALKKSDRKSLAKELSEAFPDSAEAILAPVSKEAAST